MGLATGRGSIKIKCEKINVRNFLKYRQTPYGLRGEGSTLQLSYFNLLVKKNSYTYFLSKLWTSLPSHIRVASDANDFKGKLCDCKLLERFL